jgi:hypothetical protein
MVSYAVAVVIEWTIYDHMGSYVIAVANILNTLRRSSVLPLVYKKYSKYADLFISKKNIEKNTKIYIIDTKSTKNVPKNI